MFYTFDYFVGVALAVLASAYLPLATAYQTCTVPFGGHGIDDAIALQSMLPNCSTNTVIVFTTHTTYNISTPVNFGNMSNVEIKILGNLALPKSVPYVQASVNASGGNLYWFTVAGNNITLSGNQDPEWGFVDSFGYQWWEAAKFTLPLGGLPSRPHGWSFIANSSVIRWMKLRKPIAWSFVVKGTDIHIYENDVDASYDLDTPGIFPFNTDGYDVKGTDILFENNRVFNGDDCVAVNSGSNNVTVRNMVCEGGHGASISGTDKIANVHFDNITSRNSLYATRFKSSINSVGNITNVTWSNINIINATFPIFATSVYVDQNTNRGKTPPSVYPANTTATFISNFLWTNVSGTINDLHPGDGSCVTDPCWYFVPNATSSSGITMQLLNETARDIRVENVSLRPVDGNGTCNVLCDPRSFTDGTSNLGFVCENGPYIASKPSL